MQEVSDFDRINIDDEAKGISFDAEATEEQGERGGSFLVPPC